jgi:hypothetical protein
MRHRQLAPGPALGDIQRRVRGDLVEPGSQRTAALEARESPPRPQQRVLQGILSVLNRPEDPVAVRVEFRAVHLDEFLVCGIAAGPAPL